MPTAEDVRTSQSLSKLRQELINSKDDKTYRHGYADENLNISIATQLKVLREQREWTQEQLAVEAQMQQPMISRYENVNYSSWSINTLRKLAVAFDVWLDVRFRSFGELVTTTEEFSHESLQVPEFDDDPFFKETPAMAAETFTPAFGALPPTFEELALYPQVARHRSPANESVNENLNYGYVVNDPTSQSYILHSSWVPNWVATANANSQVWSTNILSNEVALGWTGQANFVSFNVQSSPHFVEIKARETQEIAA